MKNAIVLVFALLLTPSTYAQLVSVGPKIGISHSSISAEGIDQVRSGESSVGFHAGLFVRISALGFYVQPEAMFTSASGQIVVSEPGSQTAEAVQDLTYDKLDIPIMFGFKIGNFIRLNAGPSFSLILDRETSTYNNVTSNYKNATVGYQLGIGLDLSRVVLDLRYEDNLSALGTEVSLAGQTFDTDLRNKLYILTLGYKLFQ